MTDAAFLDPQIGFYRRANGKRSWREERLGAVLEMIRNGDLWKPGDRLLVGLTAQAMARAGDLEAEWAGSVAPAPDVLHPALNLPSDGLGPVEDDPRRRRDGSHADPE